MYDGLERFCGDLEPYASHPSVTTLLEQPQRLGEKRISIGQEIVCEFGRKRRDPFREYSSTPNHPSRLPAGQEPMAEAGLNGFLDVALEFLNRAGHQAPAALKTSSMND